MLAKLIQFNHEIQSIITIPNNNRIPNVSLENQGALSGALLFESSSLKLDHPFFGLCGLPMELSFLSWNRRSSPGIVVLLLELLFSSRNRRFPPRIVLPLNRPPSFKFATSLP